MKMIDGNPQRNSLPMLDDTLAFRLLCDQANAMISFFRKRVEIEETYCDQLAKLLLKQDEMEVILDADGLRLFPSSVRRTWKAVVQSLKTETDTHRAFIYAIQRKILDPLVHFKDEKDRIRRRVKEEQREAILAHTDYKNTVSKLQRNYTKKCSDLQEIVNGSERETNQWNHHSQPQQRVTNASPPPTSVSFPPMSGKEFEAALNHHDPNSPFITRANSRESTPPPGSSPLPPTHTTPIDRDRSPAPTTLIVSAATSSNLRESLINAPPSSQNFTTNPIGATKNQVNTLLKNIRHSAQDLDRQDGPTRLVRMKTEAEESDVLYRHAVHHLETLRLQRERVTKASKASIDESAFDFSTMAHDVLTKWLESSAYVASGMSHTSDQIWQRIHEISAKDDATEVITHTEFPTFSEPPVLYNSFFVGPCLSLLFGVSLVDYSAQFPTRSVPLIVAKCVDELNQRGLDVEGLYRVSGKITSVQALTHAIEKDESAFRFDPKKHEPHSVAGVLKLYFRQLPTPLFPMTLVDRSQFLNSYNADPPAALHWISKRARRLHPMHQATLQLFCQHLSRVALKSNENKMSSSNLSRILSQVVFGEDPEQNMNVNLVMDADLALEPLILHHHIIFLDGQSTDPNKQQMVHSGSIRRVPPLPAKPANPQTSRSEYDDR